MKIFYRISDGSYPKVRFENATKENCLHNFIQNFPADDPNNFVIVADNVKDETIVWIKELLEEYNHPDDCPDIMRTNGGSSAAGFRIVFEEALKLDDEEIVYFVEDDYCHLPNSHQVLIEGLERSHYCCLYTHRDKFIPASKGGNPFIGEDGAEATKVFVTDNSYWMLTNSTTMTFASRVGILREDEAIWKKHIEGTYPNDMDCFLELRNKGRTLIQPIPTKATHCEPAWAAHLHGTIYSDWNEVLK